MPQATPVSRLGLLLLSLALLGGCATSQTFQNPESSAEGKPRRDAITWESGV